LKENQTETYAEKIKIHSFDQDRNVIQRGGVGRIIYPTQGGSFSNAVIADKFIYYATIAIKEVGTDVEHPVFILPLVPLSSAIGYDNPFYTVKLKKLRPLQNDSNYYEFCKQEAKLRDKVTAFLDTLEYTTKNLEVQWGSSPIKKDGTTSMQS
jgi:hypothetical protein